MAEDTNQQTRHNVYFLGVTSLFNDMATEMAYWVLPAFLMSLGAGPAALGLIEGIAESVASIGKLFSGYLADTYPRRKPIVVFGYALANVVKPLLALSTRWWHVLGVRFADRTAKGIRGTSRDVLLSESVPKEKVGSAFGLLQSMDSAGAVLGPLIALLILARTGNLRLVFLMAAVPGAIAILAALLIRETGTRSKEARTQKVPWKLSQLPQRFYFMLAAVLIFSLGNSSDMFLVLRAQEAGIAVKYAPLLGLVFNLSYTLGAWPVGWLSDRRSKPAIAAVGYVIFAAAYDIFAAAPSRLFIWVTMAGYGLYYALTSPVLRALVVETVGPTERGAAFGLFYFSTSIATLLASLLTGQLWKRFGAPLPLYLSAGLALVAAFLLLVRPKSERADKPSSR